jgi:hypothetical protein
VCVCDTERVHVCVCVQTTTMDDVDAAAAVAEPAIPGLPVLPVTGASSTMDDDDDGFGGRSEPPPSMTARSSTIGKPPAAAAAAAPSSTPTAATTTPAKGSVKARSRAVYVGENGHRFRKDDEDRNEDEEKIDPEKIAMLKAEKKKQADKDAARAAVQAAGREARAERRAAGEPATKRKLPPGMMSDSAQALAATFKEVVTIIESSVETHYTAAGTTDEARADAYQQVCVLVRELLAVPQKLYEEATKTAAPAATAAAAAAAPAAKKQKKP